jgi:hypothetical protein
MFWMKICKNQGYIFCLNSLVKWLSLHIFAKYAKAKASLTRALDRSDILIWVHGRGSAFLLNVSEDSKNHRTA